jgi:hypothetical protein
MHGTKPGKARLRSEIVAATRGLHRIGAVSDEHLKKTTVKMQKQDSASAPFGRPHARKASPKGSKANRFK